MVSNARFTSPKDPLAKVPEAPKPKYRRRRCQLTTCNKLYTPARPNQRFCSKEHKDEFHFKTESYSRTKAEVLKLVEEKCFALVEKLARRVFLELETSPPPALVDRLAQRIADMIRAGTLRPPTLALPARSPFSDFSPPEA